FIGTDSLLYEICELDDISDCITAMVFIEVTAETHPMAENDFSSTLENTLVSINVLENDTNIDASTLNVIDAPQNGTFTVENDELVYTPNNGFVGTDSLLYEICELDDISDCVTAMVFIEVTAETHPMAENDFSSTLENTLVSINVLDNDTNIDASTLNVIDAPQNGTFTVENDELVYTPNNGFIGTDSLLYEICELDDISDCVTAMVFIEVTAESSTTDDEVGAVAGIATQIDIIGNDDDNIDPTTVAILEQPENGTVEVNPETGVLTYTPNEGFAGVEIITYTACDDENNCDEASVVITVLPSIIVPDETPTSLCLDAETTTEICIDIEEATEHIDVAQSTASAGSLSLSNDNCMIYDPVLFEGTATITMMVCETENVNMCREETFIIQVGCFMPTLADDIALIDANSVTINGQTINTEVGLEGILIPVANNDQYTCDQTLTINIVEAATNGETTMIGNEISYVPDANFSGINTITYEACNDCGLCNTAIAVIEVNADTTPCDAFEANICAEPLVPILVCPTFCLPTDNYAIVDASTTFSCSLALVDGCIQYTALPLFEGSDIIEIVGCDEFACDTVYVHLEVGTCNENEAPIAETDYATAVNGIAINIDVLENDTDADNDELTVTSFTQPLNGTVTLVDGILTYTPNADYEGEDNFVYQICDTENNCDMAVVFIDVIDNTDCSNEYSLCAEPITPIFVCPEFCNLDANDNITIVDVETTYNCSVYLQDDGCVRYTALPLFAGSEVMTIIGCNNFGLCDTINITINVTDDCAADNESDNGAGKEVAPIENSASLQIIDIYPQPATQKAYLNFVSQTSEATIIVYDLVGKIIFTQNLINLDTAKSNQVAIDVSKYASGLYTVVLETKNETVATKLLKQ
ncbi:MAG: Ig-like domain-containing protein, partial [Chitinophagales bacterium]